MTAGSAKPVLVLGLGNLLLGDDAAGLKLLAALSTAEPTYAAKIEFVDGGTQGLALLHYFANRRAVLVLDAVGLGAAPGSVHVLRGPAIEGLRAQRATTAHEGNALELLATARLLGDTPEEIVIVGIEPARIVTGIDLSPQVEASLPAALDRARAILDSMLRR
jgi:hydrogenase maturation protease